MAHWQITICGKQYNQRQSVGCSNRPANCDNDGKLLCRITANFSMQLTHIIRETRYLDRMTFTIPEYALNVTLQEDRYLQCVDGLTDMLGRYYKVC